MPMPNPTTRDFQLADDWLAGHARGSFYTLPFTVRRAIQQRRMTRRTH